MFSKREAITFAIIVFYITGNAISTTSKPLKEPVRRLQKAHSLCVPAETFVPASVDNNKKAQITSAYIRCMAKKMGLWTDKAGYNAKQVAKFFIKHQQINEVMTVVDYCNQKHQQANLDKWAYEAYRCATVGTIGTWLKEYMKSVKL